jgi:hypothetical protein
VQRSSTKHIDDCHSTCRPLRADKGALASGATAVAQNSARAPSIAETLGRRPAHCNHYDIAALLDTLVHEYIAAPAPASLHKVFIESQHRLLSLHLRYHNGSPIPSDSAVMQAVQVG